MVTTYRPASVLEALRLKQQAQAEALFVAGGTDIMPAGRTAPVLIYLQGIDELREVSKTEDVLRIGAGCTYTQLIGDKRIPEILREAMQEIASPAIRNVGTLAGNICNASPAGDTLPLLYVLDAILVMGSLDEQGKLRTRRLGIEAFIQGVRRIALRPSEMVLAIEIPCAAYEQMTKLQRFKAGARKAQAIAKLSFAGLCRVEGEVLQDVRIAFGAVGATVIRSWTIEAKMQGLTLTELAARRTAIVQEYGRILRPIDDQRSTAAYRRQVCLNLLEDFLRL